MILSLLYQIRCKIIVFEKAHFSPKFLSFMLVLIRHFQFYPNFLHTCLKSLYCRFPCGFACLLISMIKIGIKLQKHGQNYHEWRKILGKMRFFPKILILHLEEDAKAHLPNYRKISHIRRSLRQAALSYRPQISRFHFSVMLYRPRS